jgi:hypothetical protein
MKKLMFSLAAAGLLLTVPVYAQNTQSNAPAATTTKQDSQGTTERRGDRDGAREQTERRGESRDRGERREGFRTEERRTEGYRSDRRRGVNVRVRIGDDGYRHRRHRGYFVDRGDRCRTVVIKKRFHGRVVIRRIHRCR